MNHKKLDHVLAELSGYAGVKKVVGDSTFVLCPFHGERTPSFRIFHSPASYSPGYGKCYGCGAKHPWDEYAGKLGLKPYEKRAPSVSFARPIRTKPDSADEATEHTYLHKPLPKGKRWRGISTDLLRKLGATLVQQYGTKFVYLPVTINGDERGYIRARLRKEEDKPSYLNKPGKWSEKYGLFGFDYAVRLMRQAKLKTIVLVEGPRDALRLLGLGIPAVAILGTQSWTRTKSIVLDLSGAERVVLCFDGDCAGLKAVEYIRPQLKRMFKVEVFDLCGEDSPYWRYRNRAEPSKTAKRRGVELWDPGNMPMAKARELQRVCGLR